MTGLARSATLLLLLLAASTAAGGHHHRHHRRHRPTTHHHPTSAILASCRATQYPALCVTTLSPYTANPHPTPSQLAHAALSVSAARAHAASAFITRLPATRHSRGAVRDCLETLSDSVDRIRSSVAEVQRLGAKGTERFAWHLENAQTWVSAALTDETTCLDSLAEDEGAAAVRGEIRGRIVEVAKVTSNALALVNRLE